MHRGAKPNSSCIIILQHCLLGRSGKTPQHSGRTYKFCMVRFHGISRQIKVEFMLSSRHPKKIVPPLLQLFFSSKGVVVEQQLLLDVSSCRFQKTSLRIMIKKLVKHLSNLIDLSNFEFGPMMLVYFIC